MVNASTNPCAGCHERDRKIADLQAKLIALEKRLKEVEADLAKAKKNLAEQAIRFVAIHRRMTQGTRSEDGRHWCERIWTIIQTCGQQNRIAIGAARAPRPSSGQEGTTDER
jgi:hypothetical protein